MNTLDFHLLLKNIENRPRGEGITTSSELGSYEKLEGVCLSAQTNHLDVLDENQLRVGEKRSKWSWLLPEKPASLP